jgi:hypothetical protein
MGGVPDSMIEACGMAKETVTRLVDDLDGGVAHETIWFGLDDHLYEIDLSTKNAKKLRGEVVTFVEHGSRVSARSTLPPTQPLSPSAPVQLSKSLRHRDLPARVFSRIRSLAAPLQANPVEASRAATEETADSVELPQPKSAECLVVLGIETPACPLCRWQRTITNVGLLQRLIPFCLVDEFLGNKEVNQDVELNVFVACQREQRVFGKIAGRIRHWSSLR